MISREERTKDFLSKADVVVMLLYAGRAFDATDKHIIFNKVRAIGVGKLLIGVNKYDINYMNGETNEAQVGYVKEQLLKASEEHSNNSIATLIKEQDPLLISANMALMSRLNLSKINSCENLSFHYNKLMSEFQISTQDQMHEKSLMPAFEDAIRDIVFNSKEEILIKKPLNFIKQIGENRSIDLEKQKAETDNELVILSKPDAELEVLEEIRKSIKKLTNDTEDALLDAKKQLKKIVDDTSLVINADKLHDKIIGKIEFLERDINRIFGRSNDEINSSLNSLISEFIWDIEEIADKYLEDFDYNDYIKLLKGHFKENIVNIQFHNLFENREEYTYIPGFLDKVIDIADDLTLGIVSGYFETVANIAVGKSNKKEWIDNFFSLIDLERIQKRVADSGEILIEDVKNNIIKDFVQPIIEKTEQLIANKANKENQKIESESKLKTITTSLNSLKTQIEEMKVLESTI